MLGKALSFIVLISISNYLFTYLFFLYQNVNSIKGLRSV